MPLHIDVTECYDHILKYNQDYQVDITLKNSTDIILAKIRENFCKNGFFTIFCKLQNY